MGFDFFLKDSRSAGVKTVPGAFGFFLFIALITLPTVSSAVCSDTEVLNESFDSGIPGDWTVNDIAGYGAVWMSNDPDDPESRDNYTGGTGIFAIADSDFYPFTDMDTELITPVIDMSAMDNVTLQFKTDFYSFSGSETADVDVRVNGGPWQNVWQKTGASYRGPQTETVDISSLAAGQSNVMIRFHYYGANWDWFWQVDDVIISYQTCCTDNDDDTFGVGEDLSGCSGSTTVEDCDDTDMYEFPGQQWKLDADADGYSPSATIVESCDRPVNYRPSSEVSTFLDCNDSDPNLNPGGDPVRVIGGSVTYYSTFAAAYSAASNSNTIESKDTTLNETLHLNRSISITVQGGYNCNFDDSSGTTTINTVSPDYNVTISSGIVSVDSGTLKIQ